MFSVDGACQQTANPPGDDVGKGIVPRAARQIFARCNENKDPLVEQTVDVQMVEIYNEYDFDFHVIDCSPILPLSLFSHHYYNLIPLMLVGHRKIHDLLRPDQTPGDGLDVREHPELGPTLYRDRDVWPPVRVESVEKMFKLLDEGTSNMTKAATLLNKGANFCGWFGCVCPLGSW
jgi:hypothetical protein